MTSLDNLALSLHQALDRLIRRLRRGDSPARGGRQFLIVE